VRQCGKLQSDPTVPQYLHAGRTFQSMFYLKTNIFGLNVMLSLTLLTKNSSYKACPTSLPHAITVFFALTIQTPCNSFRKELGN